MSETNKKLVEITPSKVTITDDDYASKVDRLVDNMVTSDDNDTVYNTTLSEEDKKKWLYPEFTHDSEGC